MNTSSNPEPEVKHWTEHILVKVVMIAIITLVLMIPSVMIHELVRERSNRKAEVVSEVSSKWGQLQTIAGPYISIPYYEEIKKAQGPSEWKERMLYYFPERLDIDGTLSPVVRKRSIFKVMLYDSDLHLKGHFNAADLNTLKLNSTQVAWEKASLHLGITDLSGIGNEVNIRTTDSLLHMTASAPLAIQFPSGLVTAIPLKEGKEMDFQITLSLKGSLGIYFVPVANQTNVEINSSWPSPKFEGQFLPDTSTISKNGFHARWTILDINRQISQQWTDETSQVLRPAMASRYMAYGDDTNENRTALGVELIDTVDHYTKNERTVKYAFLLVTLTFVVYFFCEVLKKQKVHPLQYGLVGAALVIFFILLLSLTEHIGFDLAYGVSTPATVILIYLYSRTIFSEKRIAGLVGGLLLLQFGFIYIILQLEDFALLAGSIALFVILALLMYLTRKIQWS